MARRIAAGEVVDRPFSVVRELLDNSLDAGSTEISVKLYGGGLNRIVVVDNGHGMDSRDLELCTLPHATSKITTEDDLDTVRSLGFRGEALSSVATCARLEITTRPSDSEVGSRLRLEGGGPISIQPAASPRGTMVQVSDLFFNMPGRKRFLKAPSAESALCRTVLLDRALAHPGVSFRYFSGDELRLFLPATDRLARIRTAMQGSIERPEGLDLVSAEGDGFTVELVLARPDLTRRDRRFIQVFVNGRRVQEYGLVQAVEYGYRDAVPGGYHPIAFLFVEVRPDLADFNIHPAKREVKLRVLPQIHRTVVQAIRDFLPAFAIRAATPQHEVTPDLPYEHSFRDTGITHSSSPRRDEPPAPLARSSQPPETANQVPRPRYLGQVFDLFLLAEWQGTLFIIDQHAAHEKLLLEALLSHPKERQELLLPISFVVTPDELGILQDRAESLESLGIELEQAGPENLEVTALPTDLTSVEEGELIRFLKDFRRPYADLEREINTLAACRMAIKDGEVLDAVTAQKLVEGALALEDARCPHGRPIWHQITREQLFDLVKRT